MKSVNNIWIILVVVLCPLVVSGQEFSESINDTSSKLSVTYGQTYNLKIDTTYSRLARKGFNHRFSLWYEHARKHDRIINVRSAFMFGTLGTEGNDLNTLTNYSGFLSSDYLQEIHSLSTSNFSVYAGFNAGIKSEIWFPELSVLRYGWDINAGVGGSASARYTISPHVFCQYDLVLHLIGVLWRSHNNGQQLTTEEIQLEHGIVASAFETPRFSHLFNSLYLDNSVKLIFAASDKIDVYYNVMVAYRHITQPLVKKGYELNNAIGISYKF